MRVGLLSSDRRDGSFAEQRERMGSLDACWPPEDRAHVLGEDLALRRGDTLVVPHARVLGRTMRQRDLVMDDLSSRLVQIEIAGGEPMLTSTPEAKAALHAEAKRSTGRGTKKQKRNKGRPPKFPDLNDEDLAQITAWFDGPEQTDTMLALVSERVGKKVSRTTLYRWMERGRADHPDRMRKPVRRRKREPSNY